MGLDSKNSWHCLDFVQESWHCQQSMGYATKVGLRFAMVILLILHKQAGPPLMNLMVATP
jgi:hypothetical protein